MSRRASSLLPALPALLIVGGCCAVPLAWLAFVLATHPRMLLDALPSAFRWSLLARTVGFNFCVALLACAMGVPVGIVLGRGRGWLSAVLWLLVPTAMFLPSLAFAYGWTQVLRLAGVLFMPQTFGDISRVIWTLAAWLWAIPACITGLALRRADSAVEQQALLDGALWRIRFRQLAGPIAASLAAVTLLATQEFSVYEPTGISVIATEIRMVFETGAFSSIANPIAAPMGPGGGALSPDQPQRAAATAATALPLLIVTIGLSLAALRTARAMATDDAVSLADWPRVLEPRWPLKLLALFFILLNVALPIAALIASLKVRFSPIEIWETFGLVVRGSMTLSGIVVVLSTLAAASFAARRVRFLPALAAATFLIGGQLLAIAFIRLCNHPGLFWAFDAWPMPVAAYVARYAWIPLLAATATWTRPWRDLREMAHLDGASPLATATKVILPLAWPTLLAGSVLAGALAMTEVPTTVMISPQHPQVLTPMLMQWVHIQRSDPMIQASLLMMAMSLLPALGVTISLALLRRSRHRWLFKQ